MNSSMISLILSISFLFYWLIFLSSYSSLLTFYKYWMVLEFYLKFWMNSLNLFNGLDTVLVLSNFLVLLLLDFDTAVEGVGFLLFSYPTTSPYSWILIEIHHSSTFSCSSTNSL